MCLKIKKGSKSLFVCMSQSKYWEEHLFYHYAHGTQSVDFFVTARQVCLSISIRSSIRNRWFNQNTQYENLHNDPHWIKSVILKKAGAFYEQVCRNETLYGPLCKSQWTLVLINPWDISDCRLIGYRKQAKNWDSLCSVCNQMNGAWKWFLFFLV